MAQELPFFNALPVYIIAYAMAIWVVLKVVKAYRELFPEKIGQLQTMDDRTRELEVRAQVEREFRENAQKELRERRAFWLEIVKAFVAPVVTALLVIWMTK